MPGLRRGIGKRNIRDGISKIWVCENSVLPSSSLTEEWEMTVTVTSMFLVDLNML